MSAFGKVLEIVSGIPDPHFGVTKPAQLRILGLWVAVPLEDKAVERDIIMRL